MNPYESLVVDFDDRPEREPEGVPDDHLLDELKALLIEMHDTVWDVYETITNNACVRKTVIKCLGGQPLLDYLYDFDEVPVVVRELLSLDSTVTRALADVFSDELDERWREGQQQIADDKAAWEERH